MRLSSGERQLVSLARAMAADPRVIVLDEATSNLDPETEATVEEALGRLLSGRTAIVIAHRLQTAQRADRVIVIGDGKVIEQGSFDELIAADGAFARLQSIWQEAEWRLRHSPRDFCLRFAERSPIGMVTTRSASHWGRVGCD